jgi:hypothetical protein
MQFSIGNLSKSMIYTFTYSFPRAGRRRGGGGGRGWEAGGGTDFISRFASDSSSDSKFVFSKVEEG